MDFDNRKVYGDTFISDGLVYFVIHLFSFIQMQCMNFLISHSISKQVGEGDGYVLIVGGFNAARSTLGDSMALSDRMKFSTK